MRALAILLFVTVAARGACIDPVTIPAGPRSIQTQCSYWKADIAAEGSHVVAAWMRSVTSGFTPNTTGTTAGGILDVRGRLRSVEQRPMNDAPGFPSVATNGQLSLLAWSRTGYGTYGQFLDADGARIGEAVRLSPSGRNSAPVRALWNGREWRVVFPEGADVVSLRVEPDGTFTDRKLVAANAALAAARGDFIVVSTGEGFRLITPVATQPLPAIPSGAVVAIGDRLLAWHGGTIGVQSLPDGNAVGIAEASSDVRSIVTADDVVLWSDGATVRGARVDAGGSTRAIAPFEGRLHAAAATPEGVVVLTAGLCGSVASRFLPHGAAALAEPEVVSRAMVAQVPHAIVPTPRGHHVVWSEDQPAERAAHLFVTAVEGFAAGPPVELSRTGSIYGPVAAAPLGDGSVVVWAEYEHGQLPVVLKSVRIDGAGRPRGAPVQIGAAWFVLDLAVAARGEEVAVFTNEHATYAYINDLWKTTIDAQGVVTRVQLVADTEGYGVDAAATPEGFVASWYDSGDDDALRLTVRDPRGTRVFPLPWPLQVQTLIGGTEPLVLWRGTAEVHALFPRTGVQVIAAPAGEHAPALMNAVQQSDGSFQVAVAPYDPAAARMTIVNVTPTGVVTPREELCFGVPASILSMRGATVDAIVTRLGGGVFVAKRPPPRRRVMR